MNKKSQNPTKLPFGINLQQWNSVKALQQLIFDSYLKVKYYQQYINLDQYESIYTVFIPSQKSIKRTFFITHGFSGTSLMFFPSLRNILKYGNVVLWDIRGMGISGKRTNYSTQNPLKFFLLPINTIIQYYSQKYQFINNSIKIIVGHSFGAYLILLYAISQQMIKYTITQYILISPCGITSKENDYKNKIYSFNDLKLYLSSKILWKLQLTYKTPLRGILCCVRNRIIRKVMEDQKYMNNIQKQLMCQIIERLVDFSDGSENIFFQIFECRVLPKYPIQPMINEQMYKIPKMFIIFGGQQDWMDKSGVYRLKQKFQQNINLQILQQCGHNIPFYVQSCNSIFNTIYQIDQSKQENSYNKFN